MNITRYDINEHGELPLSNGRYCRWEDVEDLLKHIKELESTVYAGGSYQEGYDDGYADAEQEFRED